MTESLLFSPLTLRGLTLKNRIVVSPMCQYMAEEGHVVDWHFQHHSRFALGGVGLAFVEATSIMRDGRITHGCTGIWQTSQIAGLAKIVDIYRAQGCATGIQIGHSGRRGSCCRPWDGAGAIEAGSTEPPWQTVGPSALPERDGYPVPHELSIADIDEIVEAFIKAAERALKAGFDTLEIHGAHGYLLHSFFSAVSNLRNDEFGGSREKRMRLPLMVSEAVRKVWPDDRPVFYRVSAVDNVEGGIVIEDTVALAKVLADIGIDVIDCSSGGMGGPATLSETKIGLGYQVPYAQAVKTGADVHTMAVGLITSPEQAETILIEGKADLIALGRELLSDAAWPYRAALRLGIENPHAVLPANYEFYLTRRAALLEN